MSGTEFLWGLVVIAAGGFICVYGLMLFKFALAAMGFGAGFVAAWWLLSSQSDTMRVLISLVAGAIGAVVLFSLVRFGIYVAGGILGLVIALVAGGLITIIGPNLNDTVMLILAAVGLVGGGIIGPRIGRLVILLATAGMGAFLVVDGLGVWFDTSLSDAGDVPHTLLGHSFAMVLFFVIFAISALSQYNTRNLMHRVVN